MVNRIADRILSAVLPQVRAAAPCGPYYNKRCYCAGGSMWYQRCRDCTGDGGGCGYCNIKMGSC